MVVRLASMLKESGNFNPVVFSYGPVEENNPYIAHLNDAGIKTSVSSTREMAPLFFFIRIIAFFCGIMLVPVYLIWKGREAVGFLQACLYMGNRMNNIITILLKHFLNNRNLKTRLTEESRNNFPSLLHFHMIYEGIECSMKWGKSRGMPIIYTEHVDTGHESSLRPYLYEKRRICAMKEYVTVFHVLSPILETRMKQVFGTEIKTAIIPNWVESHEGNKHRSGEGIFTVGAAGRIVELKGFHVLVESLQILKRDYNIEFYCEIAGEGEYKTKIIETIAACGLQKNIELLGRISQNEMKQFMTRLNVFVQPSYSEALSLILLHAMSCSVPVITTNVGGIPDCITDGINGLMVPPQNSVALAGALLKIHANPGKAKKNGRGRKKNLYRKIFQGGSISAIYRSLQPVDSK